ncbi:MAG: TIGR04372 family glycosyltransferase [Proteobacteria bacterium]|nr:TIGR04372 family glycosyltransferase [Pseudomonadota bacterium]
MAQVRRGGAKVLLRKVAAGLQMVLTGPVYVLALPVVLATRLVRPWLLVRIGVLNSLHLGHFAGNTEVYLCERDAGLGRPARRHVDLFYLDCAPCNRQLALMWKRVLRIWPRWIMAPMDAIDRVIPGTPAPRACAQDNGDRDIHNLLERYTPHLSFTPEEEARGSRELARMGVPPGARFVCLNVRDSAYNEAASEHNDVDWSYHNFRNSDIRDYAMAAEELANRGYFVIRVGAKVRAALPTFHPRVIDYATNGMRTEFMDIYLGAKCGFCLSVGSGFDSIPIIFRRPVAYVNMVPVGYLATFLPQSVAITKHHACKDTGRELTLAEIFHRNLGHEFDGGRYASGGVRLVDNSPQEIRDLAVEMAERLAGTWQPAAEDEALQKRFWEVFPTKTLDIDGKAPLHGAIRMRFGAAFLRNDPDWLGAAPLLQRQIGL